MLDGLPGRVPGELIVFTSDKGRNADVICSSPAQLLVVHILAQEEFFSGSLSHHELLCPFRMRDSNRMLLWVLHTCMEGYMNIHGHMCGEGRDNLQYCSSALCFESGSLFGLGCADSGRLTGQDPQRSQEL